MGFELYHNHAAARSFNILQEAHYSIINEHDLMLYEDAAKEATVLLYAPVL